MFLKYYPSLCLFLQECLYLDLCLLQVNSILNSKNWIELDDMIEEHLYQKSFSVYRLETSELTLLKIFCLIQKSK